MKLLMKTQLLLLPLEYVGLQPLPSWVGWVLEYGEAGTTCRDQAWFECLVAGGTIAFHLSTDHE